MRAPRLLDLFCGAGGCSVGYARAGFEVYGVDNRPMPRYPFQERFEQRDAMEALACLIAGGPVCGLRLADVDAIHASPPCQAYSQTRTIHAGKPTQREHPDLVDECRKLLTRAGKPWVVENVPGAPMTNAVVLCGTHFGLRVKRHRLFESSLYLMEPGNRCSHPPRGSFVQAGRPIRDGDWVIVAGHISSVRKAGKAMGIDWMTRDELTQAIPPAYTEFVGRQLMTHIEYRAQVEA